MEFHLEGRAGRARAGTLRLPHGEIPTPVFMPVGTLGTVKGVPQKDLSAEVGTRLILGYTYHLYLRPGTQLLRQAGGLRKFMGWDAALLTDSGGYQVYSLSQSRKITEEGVSFQSHIDGSHHFFSPESVMEIQRDIGADIVMAFDECPPYPCEENYLRESTQRTQRWTQRALEKFQTIGKPYGHAQVLFPIVQGGTVPELRKQSAEAMARLDLPGIAIGGLSVGEPKELLFEMTALSCEILPQEKPRYLMGVGTPSDILQCIALGVDLFDCVLPTRNGRNGMLFTSEGILNIRNEKWKADLSPLDPGLKNAVSDTTSKAYLRHLMLCGEILGAHLASLHNLCFYMWLVKTAREKILSGEFENWKNATLKRVERRL